MNTSFPWRGLRILLCVIGVHVGFSVAADAQDRYLEAKPPRRFALVVGNANYLNAVKLPGARADADKIDEVLRGLDFAVTKVTDVKTRAEFLTVHFLPFVSSIAEGDIAVFYFSGHGFTYGGENYLAPLQFPRTVKSGDVFATFISASSLHMLMNDRRPGFILMLLDACRNIGDFIDETDPTARGLVAKGLAEARIAADNIVIGFSSDAGAISLGSESAALSVYTESLSEHLPTRGTDLDDVRKDVRFFVRFRTGNKQVPWFSDSSSAEVYLNPSPEVLADEKEFWIATLKEGTRLAVARFVSRHGTGPYGVAARRWLEENPEAPEVRISAVSPIAPEAAWVTQPGHPRGDAVRLPRIEGDLAPRAAIAMARDKGIRDQIVAAADARTRAAAAGAAPGGGRAADIARSNAEALASAGEAVVTRPVEARTRPRTDAPASLTLEAGTRVAIEGVETDAQGNAWLRLRPPGTGGRVYVAQQRLDKQQTVDIGQPLAEVNLSGRTSGLKSLVDEAPLVKVIEELKRAGKEITWASLSTPRGDTKRQDELYDLRAVHVRSVLADNGLSRDRITTVEGAPLASGDLRVQIFGH